MSTPVKCNMCKKVFGTLEEIEDIEDYQCDMCEIMICDKCSVYSDFFGTILCYGCDSETWGDDEE